MRSGNGSIVEFGVDAVDEVDPRPRIESLPSERSVLSFKGTGDCRFVCKGRSYTLRASVGKVGRVPNIP